MNLLKLKLREQGLGVLLFFAFSSCDKILPPSGNGVDIPVTIGAVSIAGGAQNETITRAGGGEKRIIGEPVSLSFGDGLMAEITVEEDAFSLLRATKLETDKTFRVIALKHDDQTYLSHADFKVGGSSNYSSPDLHVPEGMECDFVCISFNSDADLPPMTAANISALTLDDSKDFLYQRITTSINGSSSPLSFDGLTHQFAKVTLVLNGGSRTITSVAKTIWILSVSTPVSFNLTTTTSALRGTTFTKYFTGWVSTSASIRQDELRLLPKSNTSTLRLPEGAITLDNTWKSKAKDVTLPALEVGKSYTVRIRLGLKDATSNMFWDETNSRLTFDKDDGAGNKKYQGVFFKWGSLIGVSPVGDYSSSSTVLYKPTNTSAPAGTPRTWVKTTGADNAWSGSSWSNIPYDSTSGGDLRTARSLLSNPDFEHYTGDICNYINPAYCMPTSIEHENLGIGDSNASGPYYWNSSGSIPTVTADGKAEFTTRFGTFTGISGTTYYLPASGFRGSSNGALYNVGSVGYYWSGSADYSGRAYYLRFYSNNADADDNINTEYGFPVRCVLR
jgi:hypothetical protein